MRIALLGLFAMAATVHAATYVVAPAGGDFTSIQAALDVAVAGDTVSVRDGVWSEKLVFPQSGNAGSGFITLQAFAGEHPILDGTGVPGQHMILLASRSYIRVVGFEIRHLLGADDGSGVRVEGAGSHLEIRDNDIHDLRGTSAMGITVYGTAATPIADLVIDGNEVHDCEPAPSEAITLNGNVTDFAVTNNHVHDVNNIGIDLIGGEKDIQPDQTKVARNGVVRGNRVVRARSSYGDGFAGAIYVDGGQDIVIERNETSESDLGLEVGAENAGVVTRGIIVRDNVIHGNDKVCIAFGGFAASRGRVRDSEFRNNTCWRNDTLGAGFGELWIQYAEDNVVRNNVFVSTAQDLLLLSEGGNVANLLDYNVWFAGGGGPARFVWNGTEYAGLVPYRTATGQDAHSTAADPLLSPDFHLLPGSPAVDAGDPATVPAPGETDLDGQPRQNGPRVDVGADEAATCGDGTVQAPEACDDGGLVDGDGCDANCTVTACGNGIITAGEQCDDGNLVAGDCCDPSCQLEATGAACNDGDPCTHDDACTAGACSGVASPATGCRIAASSSILLKATPRTITWKWTRGTTSTPEWGDPSSGATGYALCLYDATGLVLRAAIPGGGTCHGHACWKTLGSAGFRYADRDATPDGVSKLLLKSGAENARITLTAKGANVPALGLPLSQAPVVTLQLQRSDGGLCWESAYLAPATKTDATQFRDAQH